jgi:hypothetical protein
MLKKLILVFILVIFFSSGGLAHAALVINEVMYDLSGSDSINSKSREWIEIYNNGSDVNIDASKWRIYDGGGNRTINGEENFVIPSGAFVIFAGDKDTFISDHAGFSGVVYDTGFTTLNNTGALLKLIDQDGNVVDSFSYTSSLGGAGDGNTLQKTSVSWVGAIPTPGATNESTTPPPGTGSGSSGNTTTGNISSTTNLSTNEDIKKYVVTKEQKIQVKISAKSLVFSGIPIEFKVNATGRDGGPLSYGKYFWNFGDGDSKELKVGEVDKLSHIYFYPGEYRVNLEYCMTYCNNEPDASDNVVIKVIDSKVFISKTGDEEDFFVEIENKGDYDADISRWVLSSDRINFIFPRNTILGREKNMIISPFISKFIFSDKNSLKLLNSQNEVVDEYTFLSNVVQNEKNISRNKNISNKDDGFIKTIEEIPKEDLTATSIISGEGDNNSRLYIFSGILIFFLLITSSIVYFIRKKANTENIADEFEILDE